MNKVEKISRHNRILRRLGATSENPYMVLRDIEKRLHNSATNYANGVIDDDEMEDACSRAKRLIAKEFAGNLPDGLHLNRDPRGYSLKLDDGYVRNKVWEDHEWIETDWGGYGLLAPEFD